MNLIGNKKTSKIIIVLFHTRIIELTHSVGKKKKNKRNRQKKKEQNNKNLRNI